MADLTELLSEYVPSTWRGVPFQCTSYSVDVAPLTKTHMGAFWSYPKVENLGTAPLKISVEGFLVGDVALLERAALQALITAPGAGILSLPTYGVYYAACISSTFQEDVSNLIEVQMEFIQVQSPFGAAAQSLLSGNFPASIGSAVANVQSSVTTAIGNMF